MLAVLVICITVTTYAYDSLYHLIGADYSTSENFQYIYDAVGNMTALTSTITSTVVTTKTYDAANRLITVTTGGDVRALEWSAAGELLHDGNDTYQWDAAGRLVSTTVDGVIRTHRYAYLGDGARISMTVGGEMTTYTLDLAAPLVQVLVANENGGSTTYLYGVVRIGEYDDAWRYHLADHLGSVRSLVDDDGEVAGTRAYRPYGSLLSTAGSANSIYGFTGEQVDPTELVYLRARYYSPDLLQFTRQDVWPSDDYFPLTLHKFLYALGNPISLRDPSGLVAIPPTCDGPKRLVFYLDGFGAEVGGEYEGRPDIRQFWAQMQSIVSNLEVNNQIYPYALDNDAGFLERIGAMLDALSQDSAIVQNVAAEIDMHAWQAGIEAYDPWAEISVVAYSGSSNAGLRAAALTVHHIDNLILLGGAFRAEPKDVYYVGHLYDIFGDRDDRRDWPVFEDWDRYNHGDRLNLVPNPMGPGLPPLRVWRYNPDKDIYRQPNVTEISVPGVSHTGYFQSTMVRNLIYLILGGE